MADDVRKTQGAKPAAPASPSRPGATAPDVLAGLDAFSRRLDEEQKAHERAEAEQRRRREEEEARRKAEAERARQAQMQRKLEGESRERRFSALEMLRKQAEGRPAGDDAARRRAQARPLLHKTLLSTLHFLAEFAKEINSVRPTTEGSYGFIYLEQGPRMTLSNAFADYRARKIDGEDVCDHVFLIYHARYAPPAAIDVAGADMEYCRRFLVASRVPFEFSASRKNDFGQPVSGTFTLTEAVPCELYIRADYDAPAVAIELLNAGRLGTGRCVLAPEAFKVEVADEIGKHILGSRNDFAKLVTR